MMRAAVLTISDSSFSGEREDVSGPVVRRRVEGLGWTVVAAMVLPDEVEAIKEALRARAASGEVDVILTTGGTGVSPRDVTPEATRAVIDKEIPGLAETMRIVGRQKTPRAVLSRAVAGLAGRVLIVNLPGSPKGALESLDAIVDLIPHIVDLAAGRTGHPEAGQPA
ncbi:MAG: MogA/MoaB family molybdenum cofactor biosynthesis protein [Bryobacteraceae bacterium]|nr:MogA/MoaB family molybdenum cofactor biosynthesis protein [Bryobacteraceae bacterium]